MRSSRAWALPLLLSTLYCSAQTTATRSPEAVAALSACAAVMGTPTSDVYATGRLRRFFGRNNSNTSEEPIVFKSKGSSQVRTEIGSGNAYVVNHTIGHTMRGGTRGGMSYHATAFFRPEHLPGAVCDIDLRRAEMSATLVGLADVRGRGAFHVLLKSNSEDELRRLLSEHHVYIDQQTGVLLKTSSYVFDPEAIQNRSLWEVYYSDVRRMGSGHFAWRIERFSDGQLQSEILLSTVRHDIAISETEFE